nr:MAG TPA: hypothetical protein [Caudoviricetes sp.]
MTSSNNIVCIEPSSIKCFQCRFSISSSIVFCKNAY